MVEAEVTFSPTIKDQKGKYEDLPFSIIKSDVLGRDYGLSLVMVSDTESKEINNKHKGKNRPTNVLAFPLSKDEGEIYINLDDVEKNHKNYSLGRAAYAAYLFIHALLHLKGFEHGSKMENEEIKILEKFKFI